MKRYWWIIIPGFAWAAAAVVGATGAGSDQRGVAFAAVMMPSLCAATVTVVALAMSAAGGTKTRRQVEISGSGPISLRRTSGGFRCCAQALAQEGGGTAEVTVDFNDELARRIVRELSRALGQPTPEPTQ